jgi:transcriptional regulator with XRE-family HTH domain
MPSGMERINHRLVAAFAEALVRRRRSAGLTQEELAGRADVSARHISFLETAKRQPSLTILAALSQGLGVSMSELAEEVEEAFNRETGGRIDR